MTDHAHGHTAHGHEGNELGEIGSQETVTVVALAVTGGIGLLMIGIMIASHFI
jgi:hypothetical protein